LFNFDQKKADGRWLQGIYPDANGTSHLATDKDQGFQAPTESISVASLDLGV
jgi:hypothetical protein